MVAIKVESPTIKNKTDYKDIGISEKTHHMLLSLKEKNSKNAKDMAHLRDDISVKLNEYYAGKSIDEIRNEYFVSKGYF